MISKNSKPNSPLVTKILELTKVLESKLSESKLKIDVLSINNIKQ